MKSKLTEQSGVALLLAIVAISFMVIITVDLIADVNRQMEDADAAGNTAVQDSLFMSGLHLVQAALYVDQQDNQFDTLLDSWATITTDGLDLVPSDARLRLQVQDLSGRLQVNSLVNLEKQGTKAEEQKKDEQVEKLYEIWLRFLLSGNFAVEDEEEAKTILDCIADWLDSDDEPREYGAEDDYYQNLSPAYSCGNGKISFIEDLLLVKGISRKLLYGDSEHEGIAR